MDFYGKPAVWRFHTQYRYQNHLLNFYLDTGKKHQILGLYFEVEDESVADKSFLAPFELLAQKVKGLALGTLPDHFEKGVFPAAWFFFRSFILDIMGNLTPYSEQKSRDPMNLICRCFGVYREDIHELIGQGVEVNGLRELGDHLKAGIGCGSCHHDLLETLTPLIPLTEEEILKNSGQYQEVAAQPLWERLDPQTFAQEVHQILEEWNVTNSLAKEFGIELKLRGTRPGSMLMANTNKGDFDREVVLKSVQEIVSEKLGKGLDIIFLK